MVASLTLAKTKRVRVSSCIMEHNNQAVVALEFHVADVTGAFSQQGGILTFFPRRLSLQPTLTEASVYQTDKHQRSDLTISKADI